MIELIRCPTCANCLGEYFIAYTKMKQILKQKIEEENNIVINDNYIFTGKYSFKEILDLLNIQNYCCRTHMMCNSNFYQHLIYQQNQQN